MTEARIETNVGRTYDIPQASSNTLAFLDGPETRDFIQSEFEGGQIAIQEGNGPALDVETQRRILKMAPIILAWACLREKPVNGRELVMPKEKIPAVEASPEQLRAFQAYHKIPRAVVEKWIDPFRTLDPRNFGDRRTNRELAHIQKTSDDTTRGIGIRLLKKLSQKALQENRPPDARHPFPQLHGYSQVIVGVPLTATSTYHEFLNRLTPFEVAQLIRYEEQHGLLDERDIDEVESLIRNNPEVAFELSKSYDVLRHIKLSDRATTFLGIHTQDLVEIVIRKLQAGLLDEETIAQVDENLPQIAFLAEQLGKRPELVERLAMSPETIRALGLSAEEAVAIIRKQAEKGSLNPRTIAGIMKAVRTNDAVARILTGDQVGTLHSAEFYSYPTVDRKSVELFTKQAVLTALMDPKAAQKYLDEEWFESGELVPPWMSQESPIN